MTVKDEEIQEQLLRAAKELFLVHGFRRVTIDDIARAIGKARSSLYYYYKTKDEILDAVIAVEIRELELAVSNSVKEKSSVEEKLIAFFLTQLHTVLKKRGLFNSLNMGMNPQELSVFQDKILYVHRQIRKQDGAILNQILTAGAERGELVKLEQEDQEGLVAMLLNCLNGTKREMVIESNRFNLEPGVAILVRSLIKGISK